VDNRIVRLAELEIYPDQLNAYKAALKEEIEASNGVDLGDPVLERSALDLIVDLSITQDAFKSDGLPLLERLGKLREISPGIDAVPFGAVVVVTLK
jgi:hypothetical protein